MIGIGEIAVIGGVLILIFGATQIPKIARSLGEGLKEFKKSVKEAKGMDEDDKTGTETKQNKDADEGKK